LTQLSNWVAFAAFSWGCGSLMSACDTKDHGRQLFFIAAAGRLSKESVVWMFRLLNCGAISSFCFRGTTQLLLDRMASHQVWKQTWRQRRISFTGETRISGSCLLWCVSVTREGELERIKDGDTEVGCRPTLFFCAYAHFRTREHMWRKKRTNSPLKKCATRFWMRKCAHPGAAGNSVSRLTVYGQTTRCP
jgi:hypothetical protein